MTIYQALRPKGFTDKDMLQGLNREVMPVLRQTRDKVSAIVSPPRKLSASAGNLMIDWSHGRQYHYELTQDIGTITFTDPQDAGYYFVRFDQTADYIVEGWPSTVKFIAGIVPTITAEPGASDLMSLFYDGSNYWAEITQGYI
jgi:hypothetical protein